MIKIFDKEDSMREMLKEMTLDILGEYVDIILCNVRSLEKIENGTPIIIYGFNDERSLVPNSLHGKFVYLTHPIEQEDIVNAHKLLLERCI